MNAGQSHTNAVVVTAEDDENMSVSSDDTYVIAAGNQVPAVTVVKSGPEVIDEGGAVVTYTYTVTSQSAATDPLAVSLLDDNGTPGDGSDDFAPTYQSGDADFDGLLDWDETWVYSADVTATLNAGDTLTNVVRVSAVDDEGDTATAAADHTVTAVDVAPVVTIVKTGSATVNEGGDTATFTITNASVATDTITVTALVDDQFGDLLAAVVAENGGNPIVLAPGASFSFDVTRTLTLNAGQTHTNVATVTATDDEDSAAAADDDHTVTAADLLPQIVVEKSASVSSVSEGGVGDQTVTYTYTVRNTSPVGAFDPLSDVTIGDTDGVPTYASGDDGDGLLEVGETWVFTLTVTLPTQDAGTSHTNTVTATATDDDGNETTATAEATVDYTDVLPAISVTKTPSVGSVNVGGTVTYTYVLTAATTNASTDPVTITSVVDDILGDLTAAAVAAYGGPIVLGPGQSFSFSVTATMPTSGVSVTNVVDVSGTDDEDNAATATDDATVILTFTVSGRKYYDPNANGVFDVGEPAVSGWTIRLDTDGDLATTADQLTATTNNSRAYSFSGLLPGTTYTLIETLPGGWVQTYAPAAFAPAVAEDRSGQNFGNVKYGAATGGRTLGFWSNKNGENAMSAMGGGGAAGMANTLGYLNTLGLVNAAGVVQAFATYTQFRTWILNAIATNMAYMLSAQLAATALSVRGGFTSGTALIYAPSLAPFGLTNPAGFVTVNALIAAAKADLALAGHSYVLSGSPFRAKQEAMKSVLEAINNNQPIAVCGLGFWVDHSNIGVIDVNEGFGTW